MQQNSQNNIFNLYNFYVKDFFSWSAFKTNFIALRNSFKLGLIVTSSYTKLDIFMQAKTCQSFNEEFSIMYHFNYNQIEEQKLEKLTFSLKSSHILTEQQPIGSYLNLSQQYSFSFSK